MRALLLAALLAPALAHADDTFEGKLAGAQRVAHVDDLVWAVTASCDAGDDTQQRQCRRVRDTRAAELANATLLVEAEPSAFAVAPWSPQKRSSTLTLTACIRCAGIDVEGKTWFVAGSKDGTAPRFAGGKLGAVTLEDTARRFVDAGAAQAFARAASNARVQLIAKLGPKAKTVVDGKPVLVLDVLGYRVYTPCDGTVLLASPRSAPLPPDKKQCAQATTQTAADPPAGAKLEQLTPALINLSMKPVVETAKSCFKRYGVPGKAKLRITVAADGTISAYEQQGDFAGGPTGKCIDGAVKSVVFAKTQREKTTFSYPIQLP